MPNGHHLDGRIAEDPWPGRRQDQPAGPRVAAGPARAEGVRREGGPAVDGAASRSVDIRPVRRGGAPAEEEEPKTAGPSAFSGRATRSGLDVFVVFAPDQRRRPALARRKPGRTRAESRPTSLGRFGENGWGTHEGDAMNAAKSRHAGAAGDGEASASTTAAPASVSPSRVSPSAALARHVEWLDFALAAARSEESWRVGRLEKATKRSRDKRTVRLGEIREEIAELSALIDAIRDLQARVPQRGRRRASAAPTRTGRTATRTRSTSGARSAAATATTTTEAPADPTAEANPAEASNATPTAARPRPTKPAATRNARPKTTASKSPGKPRPRRSPGPSSTGQA